MLMFLLRIIIAAWLIAPTWAAAQEETEAAPVVVKTKRASIGSRALPRLVALAEENSPVIMKYKNNMQAVSLEQENAFSVMLPSLDIESNNGLQNVQTSGGSPYVSNFRLFATENLYDNGLNLIRLKIADLKFERARLEYEFFRDQQLLNVAVAYLDWSNFSKMRDIDENKRDLLKRQFNAVESQYKQGLKSKRDVLRIETEIRRLEIDIMTRDNDIDINFQKMASAAGLRREDLEKEDLEAEETKPYASFEANPHELKVSDHRRKQILDFAHRQAQLEVGFDQRDYWPRLNLTGNLSYAVNNYIDSLAAGGRTGTWNATGLVTLSYNIWDWGLRSRRVELSKIKAKNVEADNNTELYSLSNDIRDVWNRVRQFRDTVRMTRELLVIEQQSYNILEAEYRNGRASYLDLITNLNSLIDARYKFTTAYFNMKKQQMQYAFHNGDLYDRLQ
jgi:outer membrane protein